MRKRESKVHEKTLVELRLSWARPGDFMKYWNWLKKAENAVTWYFAHTNTDECKISEIWGSRDGCEVACTLSAEKVTFLMANLSVEVKVEVELNPPSGRPKCLIVTTKHGTGTAQAVTRQNAIIEDGKLLVTGLAS